MIPDRSRPSRGKPGFDSRERFRPNNYTIRKGWEMSEINLLGGPVGTAKRHFVRFDLATKYGLTPRGADFVGEALLVEFSKRFPEICFAVQVSVMVEDCMIPDMAASIDLSSPMAGTLADGWFRECLANVAGGVFDSMALGKLGKAELNEGAEPSDTSGIGRELRKRFEISRKTSFPEGIREAYDLDSFRVFLEKIEGEYQASYRRTITEAAEALGLIPKKSEPSPDSSPSSN